MQLHQGDMCKFHWEILREGWSLGTPGWQTQLHGPYLPGSLKLVKGNLRSQLLCWRASWLEWTWERRIPNRSQDVERTLPCQNIAGDLPTHCVTLFCYLTSNTIQAPPLKTGHHPKIWSWPCPFPRIKDTDDSIWLFLAREQVFLNNLDEFFLHYVFSLIFSIPPSHPLFFSISFSVHPSISLSYLTLFLLLLDLK